MIPAGVLYLVGTPIGNLGDLTPRGAETLAAVSVIAAEDTRRTAPLLERIGARAPLLSFHAHNEAKRVPELMERLARGESVAVVSDAGNPGISDPAERLVRAAAAGGIRIVPVPGPSAFLAALVAGGLPTGSFRFDGYPPARRKARRDFLAGLRAERSTLVLYESPKRVAALMEDVREILGDRRVVLARELTKKFEEFFRGAASEASAKLSADPPRGEFTVLLEGAGEDEPLPAGRLIAMVREEVAAGSSLRDAVRVAARIGLWKEQEVYRLVRNGEGEPFLDRPPAR
ncbi:MAG: 16S rRNA (cytidine(1402)-2'-O)-methyltransferase [Candidatus Eisenbacteria bacterium]